VRLLVLFTRKTLLACLYVSMCVLLHSSFFLGYGKIKYILTRLEAFLRLKLSSLTLVRYVHTQPSSCPGHQDVTGITINTVLIRPGLHTQKKFSGNYPQLGRRPKKFRLPRIKHKNLKNISFKGCQNINLTWAPTCLQPGPIHTLNFQIFLR
jgi:hypothetical protein